MNNTEYINHIDTAPQYIQAARGAQPYVYGRGIPMKRGLKMIIIPDRRA